MAFNYFCVNLQVDYGSPFCSVQQRWPCTRQDQSRKAPKTRVILHYVKAILQMWLQQADDVLQSTRGANLIYRYPILLDACASEMQRRGDSMMSKWAEVMTNMRPKTYFLRPDVALQMGFAVLREVWAQKVMGKPDQYVTRGR